MSRKRLHLVILPLSAYGHLIPAVMLAQRLVNLGYEVTYVCPEYRLKKVLKQAEARGSSEGINFRTLKRNMPNEELVSDHDTVELMFWLFSHYADDAVEFKEIMEELLDSGGNPPCCMITDNLLASWAQEVANELKIPRIVLYPSPALALAIVFYLKYLLEQGQLPIRTNPPQDICLPGMESSVFSSVPPEEVSSPIRDTSSEAAHRFYIDNGLRLHDANGILCNTFIELEKEACKTIEENRQLNPNKVPFVAVGPVLPDSYFQAADQSNVSQEEEPCLKWLDQQPLTSVIYICFGSFGRPTAEQITELAYGLESSGKRFLWMLPSDEVKNLPAGFLERIGEKGFVLQTWAPQLKVLSHKATGAFLSHCGWNSTLESISQGVPMITLPLFGEQAGNARIIVEHLGIGVRLLKDEIGLVQRQAVEAAVMEVIDKGDEMRKRAAELKEAAQAAAKAAPLKMDAFIQEVVADYRKRL